MNYALILEKFILRPEFLKPADPKIVKPKPTGPELVDPRFSGTRDVCCEYGVALIIRFVGTMDSVFSFTSVQNCKFQPQARDPNTGQYYLFCSNACAAPRTLPGLPSVPNTVGGRRTSMWINPNTDATPTPALSLCDVSLCPEYNLGVPE